MLGLVVLTMGIIWLMSRLTKVVPAAVAAIGIFLVVLVGFGLHVPRVSDLASIQCGVTVFIISLDGTTWQTLKIVLIYVVILAVNGLI